MSSNTVIANVARVQLQGDLLYRVTFLSSSETWLTYFYIMLGRPIVPYSHMNWIVIVIHRFRLFSPI